MAAKSFLHSSKYNNSVSKGAELTDTLITHSQGRAKAACPCGCEGWVTASQGGEPS